MDFTIPHRISRILIGPTIVLQRNNLLKCPTLKKNFRLFVRRLASEKMKFYLKMLSQHDKLSSKKESMYLLHIGMNTVNCDPM